MDTPLVDSHASLNIENHQQFIDAVSICAELEAMCVPAGMPGLLPFIGMARNEITDYGSKAPTHYRAMRLGSVDEGVNRLEGLLTALMSESNDLMYSVRLHEAREILREGLRI